jgi:hypothetical protein
MDASGSLDLRPAKIPAPDAGWFLPQWGDLFAGFMLVATVVLFTVFWKRLGGTEKPVAVPMDPIQALRMECLRRIRVADADGADFAKEIWDAVRDFLVGSGKLPSAKTLTAEDFVRSHAGPFPDLAILARHLAYAPPASRTSESRKRLREAAEKTVTSL